MAKSPRFDQLVETMRANYELTKGTAVAEQRTFMEDMHARIRIDADVVVTAASLSGVPCEWVATPNAGDPVVLYFHGGGYVMGSAATHREMASRIARAATGRVLLADYRLAPEHPFPAALEDAVAIYRGLTADIAPERIVIAGDSAGGGLTLATLVALRDRGLPLPAGAVTLSAWSDLAQTGESMVTRDALDPSVHRELCQLMADTYLAGGDPRDPLASPLYADLAGLPPLLMQVGTREVLMDDTTRVTERARAAGVDVTVEEYDDMFHVFQLMAFLLPEGQEAIDAIGAFVRKRTGAAVST